ncbi:hypothetical protein [Tsuneonella sp. HG222]
MTPPDSPQATDRGNQGDALQAQATAADAVEPVPVSSKAGIAIAPGTPLPWSLETSDVWPFDLHIVGPGIDLRRIAHSSRANTIEDVRDAVGFGREDVSKVRQMVEAQEADAAYIVRACNAFPELVEALERCQNFIANTEGEIGDTLECGELARAALAKARGQ